MRLKKPPIYAEILAKKGGREEDATAEFCIKIACWLMDLKKWALNMLEGEHDPQDAIDQLINSLEKIEVKP